MKKISTRGHFKLSCTSSCIWKYLLFFFVFFFTCTRCLILEFSSRHKCEENNRGSSSCLPPKKRVSPVSARYLGFEQAWFQHHRISGKTLCVHIEFHLRLQKFCCCLNLQRNLSARLQLVLMILHQSKNFPGNTLAEGFSPHRVGWHIHLRCSRLSQWGLQRLKSFWNGKWT